MPFFQVDDQLQVNQKAIALAEMAMDDNLRGIAALGLWTLSGSWVQAAGTDGRIPLTQLTRFLLNRRVAVELADLLVERRLWHATGHDCPVCPQPDADAYVFHDWFQMKYDHAVDVRLKRAKSKELKDPALIASVWARDCTDDPAVAAVGRCRYCKTELKRKDTRSQNRPEMDHVDPKLAAGVTNVVLSCYQCNRTKGQRTPEQAGMTLHPAPRQTDAAAADRTPQAAADAGAGSKPGAAGPHTDVRAGAERFPVPPALEPPSSSTRTSEQDQPGTSGGRPDGDALLGRTRGHERPGRAGQGRAGSGKGKGQGSGGAGLGEGSGQGSGQGGRRRRRGSRGRGRSGQPQTRPDHKQPSGGDPPVQGTNEPPIGRAGDAPEVLTGGRYGSPYFGWSGPPSFVEESVCVEHGLDKPCRKCEGGEQ